MGKQIGLSPNVGDMMLRGQSTDIGGGGVLAHGLRTFRHGLSRKEYSIPRAENPLSR
jgi:hypothetical protein